MILEDNSDWKQYAASGTLHYFAKFGGEKRIKKFHE
jgi:hypothetical protein